MTKLKDHASIEKIISEMTLEEKLLTLSGESTFRSRAMPEYGIPQIRYFDGSAGLNYTQMFTDCYYRIHNTLSEEALWSGEEPEQSINYFGNRPNAILFTKFLHALQDPALAEKESKEFREALEIYRRDMNDYVPDNMLPGCFPAGILLGATWNPDVIQQCAKAVAREAGFYKVDVLLGTPNVNIHRDPRNGRLFEGYSEDPFLTAALAPAFVRGVQEEGVVADVKHFAANNQETERRSIDEHITERALQEIYFPGFRACVQAGCRTVMSAYNSINGVPCAQNKWLLEDVLRGEWGFTGAVVSDWAAVYDQVAALEAGNDIDMPGPRSLGYVRRAVLDGRLDEETVNRALRRYLAMVLETPAMNGKKQDSIDRTFSRQAAYQAVAEGMVLLKNANQALPLSPTAHVSFFGAYSKRMIESGGGSGNVITDQSSNIYSAVCQKIGANNVRFEAVGFDTDAIIVTVGVKGQESFDRADLEIGAENQAVLEKAIAAGKRYGCRIIVLLNVCGPVEVAPFLDEIDALLCMFIPGMEGGNALADALFGDINPSGKLPLTFPKRYRDCPTSGNFPGHGGHVYYGEGIFVGYRYYDYKDVPPCFPFGFGLSYTDFLIHDLTLSAQTLDLDGGGQITATVRVKNVGPRPGKEVVQMYIAQDHPSLVKPPRELKGFQKVALEPGQEKTVSFTISKDTLQSYDDGLHRWISEPDLYHVYLGSSSRALTNVAAFRAVGYNPVGFGPQTRLDRIVATPGALETILKYCPPDQLDRETVELGAMFSAASPLCEYWKKCVEPSLSSLTEEQRKSMYEAMLLDLNQFR